MIANQMPQRDSDAAAEADAELSIEELGRACAVQARFIIDMVEEGVIAPLAGDETGSWRFGGTQVHRVRVAWRLQRDLGVNAAGAALALQLLEEMETLRAQINAGSP